MGNAGTKRTAGGTHRVDMNPLVITGGFGEQIDALLVDGQPFGVAQVQAFGRKQRLGTAENVTHD
ncbi:hypothetical protein D3C84_1006620 [compost metagenome]